MTEHNIIILLCLLYICFGCLIYHALCRLHRYNMTSHFLLIMSELYKYTDKCKNLAETTNTKYGSLVTIVCTTPQNIARMNHMHKLLERQNLKFVFTWQIGSFIDKRSSIVHDILKRKNMHKFIYNNPDLYIAHCLSYIISLMIFIIKNLFLR